MNMLRNIFKTAWCNLSRSKGFSAVNILGLTIGMASASLIFLWIQNEVSHDKFHTKKDRLYVANNRDKFNGELWAWGHTSKPLATALKQDFSEVEDTVRTSEVNFLFTVGEQRLNASGLFTDTGFLNMFGLPLLKGNTNALKENYAIVHTQKMAKRLFGNEDAMGKVLRIDSSDNFTVTGVLKELSNNTRFNFDYLLPWTYLAKIGGDDKYWGKSFVKTMRFKHAIGQTIKSECSDWKVVGVIKDFIYELPYGKISSLLVMGPRSWFNMMHVKLNPQKTTAGNLAIMENIFKQYNPQYPFDYKFIDDEYAQKFNGEKRIGTFAGLFDGLTIFISCLGFFGLASYMVEKRIKEIGVRKVMGASVTSITTLLSKYFLKLVIASFLIASPIAWWAMHQWLQGYNYRVSIEWWVFALAAIVSIVVALLTISYQAIKAATANPVKSLRTE